MHTMTTATTSGRERGVVRVNKGMMVFHISSVVVVSVCYCYCLQASTCHALRTWMYKYATSAFYAITTLARVVSSLGASCASCSRGNAMQE